MILFFDPFMGMAGDMTVAALVDAGADPASVNEALASLGMPGLAFTFEGVRRQGVKATLAVPSLPQESGHRRLGEILGLIEGSGLSPKVRSAASEIFRRLAEAEAEVHGCEVEAVHFHEVGAADAIADVVGACAAWESLGCPAVECGALNLGSGFTVMEHGAFPVPPPAVAELVKGLPVFSFGPPMERTTPTGAAIAVALARGFGSLPSGKVSAVGYGAGTRDPEGAPNVLRAFLIAEEPAEGLVSVIEAQVDDMTPEWLAGAMETLRGAGALDVFSTPVQAKKGRPGWTVTVLCSDGEEARFSDMLLEHTTTIGVRFSRWRRRELLREVKTVHTPYGPLHVKTAITPSGHARLHPEWEDLKAISERTGLSVPQLMDEIRKHLP